MNYDNWKLATPETSNLSYLDLERIEKIDSLEILRNNSTTQRKKAIDRLINYIQNLIKN